MDNPIARIDMTVMGDGNASLTIEGKSGDVCAALGYIIYRVAKQTGVSAKATMKRIQLGLDILAVYDSESCCGETEGVQYE